jgi:hypothetical protein
MKNPSDFVNGSNGFAVTVLILLFVVAFALFQATIYWAK